VRASRDPPPAASAVLDPGSGAGHINTFAMLRHMIRHRWRPAAASATIRFRRSLRPFQKFQIRTRLMCWDEQWSSFEQRFESEGGLVQTPPPLKT
jgi:acyl-CoA thioesterase FadM